MKIMKAIGKAFVVAFSIYSKIPMPRFQWESEDMQYHLCFFPWIGAVIGALEWGWYSLAQSCGIGQLAFACICFAIPLLVTGGFHVDGFMDTCDALHSYQEREKKLEILKDPHIGAFSVICLLGYTMIAMAAISLIDCIEAVMIGALGFFLSRAFSGLSIVTMKGAKNKGMLSTFSTTASKQVVRISLFLQATICIALMITIDTAMGISVFLGALLSWGYYYKMSHKEFGGITGDLAGFFVCITEIVTVIVLAIWCVIR